MKIAFLSNYYNHHQKSLSEALFSLSEDFRFIETGKIPEERKRLGWGNDEIPKFVSGIGGAENFLENADVIIAGSAPEKLVWRCIKAGKAVFRYSERPLKKGSEPFKYPFRFIKWNFLNPKNRKIYLLSASAFAAGDYRKFGLFENRTYKWGYFPETVRYENIENLIDSKNKNEILWCGRFIDWKQPEICVEIAEMLRNAGFDFRIKFIGCGKEEEKLRKAVFEKGLSDSVVFCGAMKPEEVRREMEKSGIFLLTSGKREGWGAVLNEAMNSGCAVIGSHLAGSVPFLLENGKNGFVYESGNTKMLFEKVKYLLENPDEQKNFGKAAYETILNEWNGEIAAERFVRLAEKVLSGEKDPELFETGPCSKAKIIEESWFRN